MKGSIPRLAVDLGSERGPRGTARVPGREYQELWFSLANQSWNSLVLVPADENVSAAQIATSLADLGRQLRDAPVSFFIVADPLDPVSAARIASNVGSTGRGNASRAGEQLIVAIRPVIVDPLGVAVAQAADAVILCIARGRTTLDAARRTIDLVGRDRITGSFFVV